ncbi:hypothetical protein [Natronorubrum aibiense]|uniref:Uncharacterized protein n=1 Tax=Natronorubrum aibiense TaxID=348826 RepID=A0A5P9P4H7_9EURY|nr:hypothetical protein [Natronorubrum aibiense]QFU83059.1 hypothetical protein GCU68_11180 [Natronorubrum aibiense]
MGETVFKTIDTLLESVQNETNDPEQSFKLRTARQLIVLLHERHIAGQDALADVDIDQKSVANLRQLGYFD